jgi:hypothetical protein
MQAEDVEDEEEPFDPPPRPRTRADCEDGPRPCPYVGCKWNLYLDVNPKTGSIKLNFPDREPWEMPPDASCVLDVAEQRETLEAVGEMLNLTRERIRQITSRLDRRLRIRFKKAGIGPGGFSDT